MKDLSLKILIAVIVFLIAFARFHKKANQEIKDNWITKF